MFFYEKREIMRASLYLQRMLNILHGNEKIMNDFLNAKYVKNKVQNLQLRGIDLEFIAINNPNLLTAYEDILEKIPNSLDSIQKHLKSLCINDKEMLLVKKNNGFLGYELSAYSLCIDNNSILIVRIICCLRAFDDYIRKRHCFNGLLTKK
ncbi:MAG: hypothetical protein LBB21_03425 [Holosporaceae bacterium]|nr:hypothetical protein [Holosporaceae bacterium]